MCHLGARTQKAGHSARNTYLLLMQAGPRLQWGIFGGCGEAAARSLGLLWLVVGLDILLGQGLGRRTPFIWEPKHSSPPATGKSATQAVSVVVGNGWGVWKVLTRSLGLQCLVLGLRCHWRVGPRELGCPPGSPNTLLLQVQAGPQLQVQVGARLHQIKYFLIEISYPSFLVLSFIPHILPHSFSNSWTLFNYQSYTHTFTERDICTIC